MPNLSKSLVPISWIALVAVGFGQVWRYESTPGPTAQASRRPTTGAIALDPIRPTVILFAHPDCPCTQASLRGLGALAARRPGAARVVVVISGAGGSANERTAGEIPGVTVVADPHATEARRFGAATSGQTYVFAPDGRTLFRGGLTELRGHEGPSAGLDALDDVLKGEAPRQSSAPVFGCALLTSEDAR